MIEKMKYELPKLIPFNKDTILCEGTCSSGSGPGGDFICDGSGSNATAGCWNNGNSANGCTMVGNFS